MAEEKDSRQIYNIKGKSFYQKQLVLGQLELIVDLLKNVDFKKGLTNLELLKLIGSKMPRVMAIVLLEEGCGTDKFEINESGKLIETEDIQKLTNFFANNVDLSLTLRMISDFFICTPMNNIMQTLETLIPAPQGSAPAA